MLQFKEDHIKLDRKNADKMPWEFLGTNNYEQTILIKATATCGCSGVNSDFKVKAGEDFKLVGFLNKRGTIGSHTKTIKVRAYSTGLLNKKQLELKLLKFTINVQNPNL